MSEEQDRLVHTLLEQDLGGETPPDLTARILRRTCDTPRRRHWLAVAAAATALIVLVGAGWLIFAGKSYPDPFAQGDYQVQDGGAVRRGATVIAGAGGAQLALGDYCRLELAGQTRLRVEGDPKAERVFLESGSVLCEVDRNVGTFAVRTDVGSVSVTGTKFTVRILDGRADGNRTSRQMVVKVLAGAVLLSGAWGNMPLAAGDEKTVGDAQGRTVTPSTPEKEAPKAEKPRPEAPRPEVTTGTIVKVEGTVVRVQPTDSHAREVGLETDAKTAVTVDGVEARAANLTPGMKVTITWGAGMNAKVAATTR